MRMILKRSVPQRVPILPPPPPKRAQHEENFTNQYEILKIDTFSAGGGGNTIKILWTKRFYGHLGVSD